MYWCDGHNEDMVSYWHGGYMLMVVTVADMGKRAAHLEKRAIEGIRSQSAELQVKGRLLNLHEVGNGAIRDNTLYVCYIAVRRCD